MRIQTTPFSQKDLSNPLEKLNGLALTSREIDVLACILSGKSVKSAAAFLSISSRTIDTYTRNIMLKLGCNSRQEIIHLTERLKCSVEIKAHYERLLQESEFLKCLHAIFPNIKPGSSCCSIYYYENSKISPIWVEQIRQHLIIAGVNTAIKIHNISDLSHPLPKERASLGTSTLYILDEDSWNELQKKRFWSSLRKRGPHNSPPYHQVVFLFLFKLNISLPKSIKTIEYANFEPSERYYNLIKALLTTLLPHLDVDQRFRSLDHSLGFIQRKPSEIPPSIPPIAPQILKRFSNYLTQKLTRPSLVIGYLCTITSVFLFLILSLQSQKHPDSLFTQSELYTPPHSSLLPRPRLISMLNEKHQQSNKIKIVALVGAAGAGKTILARQYARAQNALIIWEINGQNRESLLKSFELLAYEEARTLEEKNEMWMLQQTQDPQEREKKLSHIVKQLLRGKQNWFLLFDNLERFSDLKNFLPYNPQVWGEGRVLITSRDHNIQSSTYINQDDIITVGALDDQEKLLLYKGIIYGKKPPQLDLKLEKAIEVLLKEIPPYPLDVSTAAYYIKNTRISPEEYCKRIARTNSELMIEQKKLWKEISDYPKTRHSLVSLAVEKILDQNIEFLEPLILISLLDSQSIPQDLLESCKPPVIIEQLMRALNQHSLIITYFQGSTTEQRHFSIHRSIKGILLGTLRRKILESSYIHMIGNFAKLMATYNDRVIEKAKHEDLQLMLRHGETFLATSGALNHLNNTHSEYLIEYLRGLSVIYRYLGHYVKAENLLQKCYNLTKIHYKEK